MPLNFNPFSGNFDSVPSTKDGKSAFTTVKQASANWNSVYTSVLNTSGNWDSVYSTYNKNSADYTKYEYVNNNFLPLSGGTVTGITQFNNNVTIWGVLSATGGTYFSNTIYSTTSAISVVHVGSGPALYVGSIGTGNIASFYDLDENVEMLHIGGHDGDYPNVGIKTSTPNVDFTVNGKISSNSIIYDRDGNSTQWNSGFTSINKVSANWDSVYSSVLNTSANWDSVYSSVLNTSGNWDSVYSSVKDTSGNWNSVYTSVNPVSSNWNSVYSTYNKNSATYATIEFSNNKFLPLSGGTITGDLIVDNTLQVGDGNPNFDFIITDEGNVGINTETPNEKLTVVGNISCTGFLYGDGSKLTGIVAGDTIATTLVRTNSANWDSVYTSVKDTSGNWNSVYSNVNRLSSNWDSVYSTTSTLSSNWKTTHSTVSSLSGLWSSDYIFKQLGQDIDGEDADDFSGVSVSMNVAGDIVAIGSSFNIGNGSYSGHVRVYKFISGSWVQQGQDIDGEAASDYSGHPISLNAAGDIVAIGASLNDGISGTDRGHVRVYKFVSGTWIKQGQDIDGEANFDQSGWSVSINAAGDIVAIGAPFNDGISGTDRGHVRVYKFISGTWIKQGLDIDGEDSGDKSGYSVSINAAGDIVAVGAVDNGTSRGHVRVYKFISGTWNQQGLDIDGETIGDKSGYSVSINAAGDIVAIGANLNDGISGTDRGHVRVYKFISGTWIKQGQDIDGEAINDQSGWSVSLNAAGDIVAIGASLNDGISGTDRGHVRVYKFISGTWIKQGLDIDGEAIDDESGYSVSINAAGDIVAIGAPYNDGISGTDSGHVRVYTNNLGYIANSYKLSNLNPTASGLLTVVGNISATNIIYDKSGNSEQWNSVYTTVQAKFATEWDNTLANSYTHTNFLPLTGGTMTGKLTAWSSQLSAIGQASLNIGPNTNVTNSVNGDIWINAGGRLSIKANSAVYTIPLINSPNTFTTNQIFSLSSNTFPAVRITQLGTSDAFRVEDDTTPDSTAFIIGSDGTVGIGLSSISGINNKLTVVGNISSTGVVYASGGNSDIWNSAYSTVQSNSADYWNYQGTDLKGLSSGWVGGNDAYTNLFANSAAYLSSVDLSFLSVSANWNSVYTSVLNTSANWDSVYTSVKNTSGNWNSVYTTVQAKSATEWDNTLANSYTHTNFLPLTGGTISGNFTVTGYISASNKIYGTIIDWTTLTRGFKIEPTFNSTIAGGDVYTYVYESSPSDKTYYRFIATNGSEDAYYETFSGGSLSNLIAKKKIII
jgi:hypothetical protein